MAAPIAVLSLSSALVVIMESIKLLKEARMRLATCVGALTIKICSRDGECERVNWPSTTKWGCKGAKRKVARNVNECLPKSWRRWLRGEDLRYFYFIFFLRWESASGKWHWNEINPTGIWIARISASIWIFVAHFDLVVVVRLLAGLVATCWFDFLVLISNFHHLATFHGWKLEAYTVV